MAAHKKASAESVLSHGFKGFDRDLKCLGKQYAVGETFEESEAKLCDVGMHYCEYPLDCLNYYAPGNDSRYAQVVAENPSKEKDSDSKRVAKILTIGAELTLHGLIEAAVKFVFGHVEPAKTSSNSGYGGAAFNNASEGRAETDADKSIAVSCGCQGIARGNLGAWIVLADRGEDGEIKHVRCGKIDGKALHPGVFYKLKNKKFANKFANRLH